MSIVDFILLNDAINALNHPSRFSESNNYYNIHIDGEDWKIIVL